jgi:hypothetical protein
MHVKTISRRDWDLCISPDDVAMLEYFENNPPKEQRVEIFESDAAMLAGLDAAAKRCNPKRRIPMAETILDGTDEQPAGHRILEGSDLEIAYNRSGDHLVLRVNKGPVQVFRVMLVDAFKKIDDQKLFNFNSVSPDFVFKIGDVREGLLAMGRAVGLDAAQMQKLEAKAREIGG